MPKIDILSPQELQANYQGPNKDGEYPAYTRADWQKAVALGETIEGYWTWVHNSLCDETAEADAEEDMDVSQVSYSTKGTCTPIDEAPKLDLQACINTSYTAAVQSEKSAGIEIIKDRVTARVHQIVAEQLGYNESDISDDKNLVDDLNADSLDTLELVMVIEEEFESDIPDHEAEKIKTVGEIVEYVRRNVRQDVLNRL